MSEPVARLIHCSGSERGRVHELAVGRHVLGRARQADIVLEHDDVSRVQAELHVHPEGAELIDLGSKNGCMVDGRRVDRQALQHGARIQFGELVLELEHPGAMVDRLLASSGEPTAKREHSARARLHSRAQQSLVAPLVMAVVFATLLVLLLIYG